MATAQARRNAVTLQGSAAIISEYLGMILLSNKKRQQNSHCISLQ